LNDLPFRDGVFDAIFGNSILHHIYDYEALLAKLRTLVRPGGQLVFSEPCQQGKSLVSFFLATAVNLDLAQGGMYFTDDERHRIRAILGIHMRELRAAPDPSIKLQWEDKHIFDTHKLPEMAHRLGFTKFERFNTNKIHDGLRASTERTMKIMGITKTMEPFRFMFDAFQKQYISALSDAVETPHQFLVFTR
jgi:SAM-dependent methyltransferase